MLRYLYSLVACISLFFLFSCELISEEKMEEEVIEEEQYDPNIEYGFDLDFYEVFRDTVASGQTLSHLLLPFIGQYEINLAAEQGQDSLLGFKYVQEGHEYLVLSKKGDTSRQAKYFIYNKNKVEYIVIDFTDSVCVELVRRPVSVEERMMSGEIVKNSNLTRVINQQTQDYEIMSQLTESLAGLFAWTVDFFKLHPGDAFKMIYEEKLVEGEPYGTGQIKAAWFRHQGHEYYTFFYVSDSVSNKSGYYDEKGKEAKRLFLMAPVKYSRISSGYSAKRFHPVQKRYKAHLGTDYAAPTGTPIFSTADGVVEAASRSKYNGIYVKVKHNDTYTTQYLHMSKHAEGIRPGVSVKQGQTIGYIGSTGLATGPHVCYRFWKNGKQINHRAEKFPASTPMPEEKLPDFLEYIKPLKNQLDSMQITPYIEKETEENNTQEKKPA